MSDLAFLSPGLADTGYRSPLAHVARRGGADFVDLSGIGKIEVRGSAESVDGAEVIQITPRRALVLCDGGDTAAVVARLRGRFACVVDVSAAYAGLAVRGEQLLRRLTDLDLDALPASGAVAGVPAAVLRDGDEFRLFFAQEYAAHVAAVVLDAIEGLA